MLRIYLVLCAILITCLSTTILAMPRNNVKILFFDADGNLLPYEALGTVFFEIERTTLNVTHFMRVFNKTKLKSMIVKYSFYERNWSLGFVVNQTDENIFRIYLSLKNISNLNLKFYNITQEYNIIPCITNLATVARDPIFASVLIEVYLNNSYGQQLFILKNLNEFIPLTDHENNTYPWIVKVYYNGIPLISYKPDDLLSGVPLELPLLIVPQEINLSKVLSIDMTCNLIIRLTCNNITLVNKPHQLTLLSPERWVQPLERPCKVEYFIGDDLYSICNQSLDRIFHNCLPEIYTVRLKLDNVIKNEYIILMINSSRIDPSNPVICLSKGNYQLTVFYNLSGLLLKVLERNIEVNSNLFFRILFNFSDILLRVKGGCTPTVYVDKVIIPIHKQSKDTYVIRHFPRIPVNFTVSVCTSNFSLNVFSSDYVGVSIDLPPSPINELESMIELTSLFILFLIILVQMLFLILLLIKLRGS